MEKSELGASEFCGGDSESEVQSPTTGRCRTVGESGLSETERGSRAGQGDIECTSVCA